MKLIGLSTVLNNMNLKIMEATGDIEKSAERAGRIVERRAKENISGKHGYKRHIVTGNLMRSIDTKAKKISSYSVIVSIGTNSLYAHHVEVNCPTGGYLNPAWADTKDEAIDFLAQLLAGKIR